MAGNRIKGIMVEIGGDTTKPQTALKGVNSEIMNTQSQLKDVEKLTTLKTAAEQANQALANGDISKEQYDALQREIIETEEDLKKLEEFCPYNIQIFSYSQ